MPLLRRLHCSAPSLVLALLALLAVPVSAAPQLSAWRTSERFPGGDPVWRLQLVEGTRVLGSWQAASGSRERQGADRLWSPGNAAPLPPGRYRVGRPEPWGTDLWIDLQPAFASARSGLGIHHCFPGVGCLCLPERKALNDLAALIQRHRVQVLTVLN
ncbi:MAG: hypothetical protein WCF98_09275 [Synechococcus sp. ELA057]